MQFSITLSYSSDYIPEVPEPDSCDVEAQCLHQGRIQMPGDETEIVYVLGVFNDIKDYSQ